MHSQKKYKNINLSEKELQQVIEKGKKITREEFMDAMKSLQNTKSTSK